VALLGDALRDAPLAALGRTLLASEAASAQAYWQMPSGSRVYPRPFRDNVVVGVLWGTKADYSTWFGDLPEYMTLIQALPFTPASTALLPAGWAGEAYAAAAFRAEAGAEPRITDGFRAMLHMLQAINDPDSAWDALLAMHTFRFHGEWSDLSKAWALYWTATRPPVVAPAVEAPAAALPPSLLDLDRPPPYPPASASEPPPYEQPSIPDFY